MNQTMNYPAFYCHTDQGFLEALAKLNCALVLSSYQAHKVVVLSVGQDGRLKQLLRNFSHPMGIAVEGARLAIASENEVTVLANAPHLAASYPAKPDYYDGLYLPRATYYTGGLDIHDMAWGKAGLWAVNTRFSCLSLINDDAYSFQANWLPHFIERLSPDDACHLNGLAMRDGEPAYVTALGQTHEAQGWRERKLDGGVLMDVASQEIICSDLSMPHSPRIYGEQLYLLNSAQGELCIVDTALGKAECIARLPGFARGLSRVGDYLFIGLSLLRHKKGAFQDLAIAQQEIFCGVLAFQLSTAQIIGQLRFMNSIEEIYDIQLLEDMRQPNLLNTQGEWYARGLSLPETGFWQKDKPKDEK